MAKKTFENDDNLPALPLPSLKNTLDLYLQSLAPFLTSDELEKSRKIVQEFGDNEGQILHEKLLQRSSEKKNWVNSSLTNRAKRVKKKFWWLIQLSMLSARLSDACFFGYIWFRAHALLRVRFITRTLH